MRASFALALVLAASAAIAADPVLGPPSPPASKLDDAALEQRFDDIVMQVRGLGLQQGEAVQPSRLQNQMDQVDDAIARAQDPTGEGAAKVRLLRGQLFELEGRPEEAAKAYRELLDAGVSGRAAPTTYAMLAALLESMGKGDDLSKLADAAEKAKQPDDLVEHIRRLSKSALIKPGKPFPDFVLTDLGGTAHHLADYRGKVLLLDCWATWCPPCVEEMPDIKAAYQAYQARGFEILAVSLDDDLDKLRRYVADHGLGWPQCCDGKAWSSAIAEPFGLTSLPAAFVIGPDGSLIARDLRGEELIRAIEKALPEKK
jgi:peroxiredoxin